MNHAPRRETDKGIPGEQCCEERIAPSCADQVMMLRSSATALEIAWIHVMQRSAVQAVIAVPFVVQRDVLECDWSSGSVANAGTRDKIQRGGFSSSTIEITGNFKVKEDKVARWRSYCEVFLLQHAEGASAGTCRLWGPSLPRTYNLAS
jgi:hypothetical protein